MRLFDYSNTQLVNFDVFAGFPVNFSSTSVFPLLALTIRNTYVFNLTYVKYHWKRLLSILSLIWLSKGSLGIIPGHSLSTVFTRFFHYNQYQLLLFQSAWVPGQMKLQTTWVNFPHVIINLFPMLACSLWTESNRTGIPLWNLVDTNSKIYSFANIIPGNSKSLRSQFFYLMLLYKAGLKNISVRKYNYNVQLSNFLYTSLRTKYTLFFHSFMLWYQYFDYKAKDFRWRDWASTAVIAFHRKNRLSHTAYFPPNARYLSAQLFSEILTIRKLKSFLRKEQPSMSRLRSSLNIIQKNFNFQHLFLPRFFGQRLKRSRYRRKHLSGSLKRKHHTSRVRISKKRRFQTPRLNYYHSARWNTLRLIKKKQIYSPLKRWYKLKQVHKWRFNLRFFWSFFTLLASIVHFKRFFQLFKNRRLVNPIFFSFFHRFYPYSNLFLNQTFYRRVDPKLQLEEPKIQPVCPTTVWRFHSFLTQSLLDYRSYYRAHKLTKLEWRRVPNIFFWRIRLSNNPKTRLKHTRRRIHKFQKLLILRQKKYEVLFSRAMIFDDCWYARDQLKLVYQGAFKAWQIKNKKPHWRGHRHSKWQKRNKTRSYHGQQNKQAKKWDIRKVKSSKRLVKIPESMLVKMAEQRKVRQKDQQKAKKMLDNLFETILKK